MKLTLVSHKLCPYVQRAAIVLMEKGVPFDRREVDLAHKPDWLLRVSPLGKTPVLLVGDAQEPLFESAVICEYLDETTSPALHPADALVRARHRGWMEVGSALLNLIAGLYNAPDDAALAEKRAAIRARLEPLEATLGAGPWFAGEHFGLVDAVFGPVFRYFEVIPPGGLFEGLNRLQAWRDALARRPSVRAAVRADYAELLLAFLLARGSALSRELASAGGRGR
jgi:glutathione S-transferase